MCQKSKADIFQNKTQSNGQIRAEGRASRDQLLDEIALVRKVAASFKFPGPDVSISAINYKAILHFSTREHLSGCDVACQGLFSNHRTFVSCLVSSLQKTMRQRGGVLSGPFHRWRSQSPESSVICLAITSS